MKNINKEYQENKTKKSLGIISTSNVRFMTNVTAFFMHIQ